MNLWILKLFANLAFLQKLIEGLLQVVHDLPHSSESNLTANRLPSSSGSRNLLLMSLSEQDILPFCIQALTNSLKV